MSQSYRLDNIGLINRDKKLSFKFNGVTYNGYEGDTLASALIANGVHLVGRSFKYHRPRGFFGAGVDEPYAIVQLYRNGETEPNIKATEQELFEGLEATSVNCWPSVNFDIGAINNFLKIFLPAGFYYKTFMWPKSFWYKVYEPFIRKAAGLGVASTKHDKERYEHKYEYCDLLIAGSGPSGLASAYAAAKNGARVILAEDKARHGGTLLTSDVNIGNQSGKEWADGIISELKEMPNVVVKNRSQVFGYYDHNMLVMSERISDHLPQTKKYHPKQRLWYIRAKEVLISSGSIERPIVFGNNDTPGVMLSSAAKEYLKVYGVLVGRNPLIFTNNDSGYETAIDAFVPGTSKQNETTLGAANGTYTLDETLKNSFESGHELSKKITNNDNKISFPNVVEKKSTTHDKFWCVPLPKGKNYKRFLDFQNDVSVSDVEIALKEGYRSIEHVKRYTTLGMATDQGKTSNLNGLQLVSNIENKVVPNVGHTTFRPPYTPVSIGAIVGREIGKHSKPTRKSPMHSWHENNNAVFVDAGVWLRPRYYKQGNENLFEGSKREAKNVRTNVGVCDVTTLGKIDIKGPDAAELLNRVYTNAWLKLPIGKARYGVMLREDGIVMDDGTTTRISENHYHMTTTTAQAANVLSHLEYYLQLVWPELNVNVVSTTEQWAGAAIAGPRSRDLLQKLFPNSDVSNEGLPFMGYMEGDLFGVKARIFRISFSGELAYEINVESDNGNFMWEKIMEVGHEFDIQPYGTEALSTLRIEMGHVAGSELDGRTIPYDNSLEGLLSKKKDFIGKRSLSREAFTAVDRQKVVGVVPLDKKTSIPEGSHLVKDSNAPLPNPKLGYISASCWSVEHDNPFSLAILKDGKNMIGEKLFVMSPLKNKVIPVEIVSSHYVDPKGERVRS